MVLKIFELKNFVFLLITLFTVSHYHAFYAEAETFDDVKTLLFDTSDILQKVAIQTKSVTKFFTTENINLTQIAQLLQNNLTASVSSDKAEDKCLAQLNEISNGIRSSQIWALKFVDAWGKIPTGVLYGNSYEFGNFDECVNLEKNFNTNGILKGKYCLAKVKAKATEGILTQIGLNYGICIPKVCNGENINTIIHLILNQFFNSSQIDLDVNEHLCYTNEKMPYETLDWVAISIFSVIGILVLLSTIYDYVVSINGAPNILLSSFSIPRNLSQLFKIRKKTDGVISCLDGIRCMSIIWVVYGHCFVFQLVAPNNNMIVALDWLKTPFSMFLQSATISVDSFFFLSGFLLAFVVFKKMNRNNGHLNVPLMYLHRILRLTPVLAVVILFTTSLHRHLGNGPLWNMSTDMAKSCNKNWWVTLLYVQNYVRPKEMCLGHTWYLAVDTQLYIISPIILIAIWKWKRKALAGFVLVGLLCWACALTTIIVNDIVIMNDAGDLVGNKLFEFVYNKTHLRATPWIIGVIFGYYLQNLNGRKVSLSKAKVLIGWIISLALIFTVIFALYPYAHNGTPVEPVAGAFYWTLVRVAWPLALCWIIFACVNGYGGPADHFLSWTFWQPFSKLSYCLYLWHMIVQLINAGLIRTNTHFSNYDVILRFWGDFGISLLVSLMIYISVEVPIATIGNALFSERKPIKNQVQSNGVSISQQNLTNTE